MGYQPMPVTTVGGHRHGEGTNHPLERYRASGTIHPDRGKQLDAIEVPTGPEPGAGGTGVLE